MCVCVDFYSCVLVNVHVRAIGLGNDVILIKLFQKYIF